MPSGQVTMMRQLHDEQAPALWGYFLRSTGRQQDPAEDLAKGTLVRAWHHPSVLPKPDASVRAGLSTVARYPVTDQQRSQRAHSEIAVAEIPKGDPADRARRLGERPGRDRDIPHPLRPAGSAAGGG